MPSYLVEVYQAGGSLGDAIRLEHPVIVGRRDPGLRDPEPVAVNLRSAVPRLVIADYLATEVSRQWIQLSSEERGNVLIENIHDTYELDVRGGDAIASGESRQIQGEVFLDLSDELSLRVRPTESEPDDQPAEQPDPRLIQLDRLASLPGATWAGDPTISLSQFPKSTGQAAVDLLRIALQVVQQAAGSDAFFQSAVDATLRIVELERAMVLVRSDISGIDEIGMTCNLPDGWCTVAEKCASWIKPETCPPVSTSILRKLKENRQRTVIHRAADPAVSINAPSLQGVHCTVASPILSSGGDLVGVLYGDRWTQRGLGDANEISELEATLVEVLAGAVSGGIARKDQERRRGNLSGFFSPRVADLLASSPDMLSGQDAQISVLFCDIRGFSSVTEKLGPAKTIEWINDVLGDLSQCVVDTEGVLVDYVGDELMAMWGAPGSQPDHASRAVETAVAMMRAIHTLRDRWSEILPSRFGAGIGVNTGLARVGNVGSRWKFKYGVLGNTVNVGSRLQAATKQLEVDCLVSRETAAQAEVIDRSRRLAKLAVVGIEQPIDVYQVIDGASEDWTALSDGYEQALEEYESERFGEATRRLGELIQRFPTDRPCRQLLARAADRLNLPADRLNLPADVFSPVWKLSRK